jgi:hypothetical protein
MGVVVTVTDEGTIYSDPMPLEEAQGIANAAVGKKFDELQRAADPPPVPPGVPPAPGQSPEAYRGRRGRRP